MPGPTETPPGRGWRQVGAAAVILVFLLAGWAMAPGMALGQAPGQATGQGAAQGGDIDRLLEGARAVIADADAPTATLEALREDLTRARNATRASEVDHARLVAEVRSRIEALGPAAAEGETEPPEVAALRAQLGRELAAAQGPLIVAQEAAASADALIGQIDRIARARISAELLGHGPSPLLPATWSRAASELRATIAQRVDALDRDSAAPWTRTGYLSRLLFDVVLLVGGIAIILVLRGRTDGWIERRLEVATDPRSVAWLVALRNLNRLVVPTVGAALLFAVLRGDGIGAGLSLGGILGLPGWVMVLIGAGWLAGSFFAPGLAAHRVAPLSTPDAAAGSRLVVAGGLALAAILLLRDLIAVLALSADTQAALAFPLVLIAAFMAWRSARFVGRHGAAFVSEVSLSGDEGGVGRPLLRLLVRGLRAIALAAPLLAAIGYTVLAGFLVVAALLTVGLLGAVAVVYDVMSKAVGSLLARGRGAGETGLVPVVVGALVILGSLPLLALIWGARPVDIREAWDLLARGVTMGGMTISLTVVVRFLLAFGLIVVLTRVIQSVLVGSVLPRTRLDVGARDAARTGVGYVGFAVAAVAGIAAAGLDLSSLAIVAGALSVGIGFGLQAVVSNFVSGIILLVERPIKPGDWIEVGEHMGYVRGIRVRSTEIETFDRASVIVPNSDLITGVVLNRTHLGMAGRLIVPVSAAYDSDPRQVERILMEIAEEHPVVLDDPPPAVVFAGFGPDGMNFELRCRLRDVNFTMTVRSDVNFAIVERFRAVGVVIPLPQRSLRIVGDKPA